MSKVQMSMGSGGTATNNFINDIILKHLGNKTLDRMADSAIFSLDGKGAFTTDSYVVRPEFFPGGDIGKISVCGTVNDLAVAGAVPLCLSLGLILPEGYSLENLERIMAGIGKSCEEAKVSVVCGDTKVVEKGALDGPVINTSGVGRLVKDLGDYAQIAPGDKVIITSDIARHGVSILLARGELGFDGEIMSDCAPLNSMLEEVYGYEVRFCRDATRGGVAAVLNEISQMSGLGFEISEGDIPVSRDVQYLCEMLGLDPLSVANEGTAVIIVSDKDSEKVLHLLKKSPYGQSAALAGTVSEEKGVILETTLGGKRYVDMPSGVLLPRIC